MHKLLEDSPGKQMLLLGNEAIARGALEAGLAFATCYPGTPSSEIPEQFFNISRETDLYFEYSTNEKVAMEVGAAAAISGVRTMVTMKHVGLNVAADPLMTLAYLGIKAGMVVINADDPFLFSSQNEQDNRYFARLSSLPMLEPTNTQEMKDLTTAAFDLSEELELPVIIRTTTRLNHIRSAVTLGELKPAKTKDHFEKNPFHFVAVPAVSRNLHKLLLEKYDRAQEKSENWPQNEIIGSGKWGIVANGVSFNYVQDAVADLGIADKVSILKLGFSWPLPRPRSQNRLRGNDFRRNRGAKSWELRCGEPLRWTEWSPSPPAGLPRQPPPARETSAREDPPCDSAPAARWPCPCFSCAVPLARQRPVLRARFRRPGASW